MKVPILECVPNFSEGRNECLINKIAQELKKVKELMLIDYSADNDHNRSVFSFIGTKSAVLEASIICAKLATENIDLCRHKGVHPRTGVIDVIPFIPLLNASFQDCIEVAIKLGKFFDQELKLAYRYYGFKFDKAKKELSLPELRKIAIGLKVNSQKGITAIGVRDFLIAYNVNLKTNDLETGKKIANILRLKNKRLGLRVLALKIDSKNIIQISMNITNTKKITKAEAYKKVKSLAKKFGIKVLEDELIGILPKKALKKAKLLSRTIL